MAVAKESYLVETCCSRQISLQPAHLLPWTCRSILSSKLATPGDLPKCSKCLIRGAYISIRPQKRIKKSYSKRRSINGRQRNSVFGAAFVRTLGLMRDPDEIWTLEKQTSFAKGKLSASTIHPDLLRSCEEVNGEQLPRKLKLK